MGDKPKPLDLLAKRMEERGVGLRTLCIRIEQQNGGVSRERVREIVEGNHATYPETVAIATALGLRAGALYSRERQVPAWDPTRSTTGLPAFATHNRRGRPYFWPMSGRRR